jgi:hypothetical protein
MKKSVACLALFFILSGGTLFADQRVFFRENFRDLKNWEPLYFEKIKQHTTYTMVTEAGRSYLRTQSRASASAIVFRKSFDPYKYPRLKWRWKVDNIYRKWDGTTKSGDDYPIRIYVMFQYDPRQADLADRIKYGAIKAIYGKYPPHSTMNYVWASGASDSVIISPYTDKARMVVLERGGARVGQWVDEAVNIIEDYKRVFGRMPPATASLAIMNDSDNTGEAAVSYVEFIEISGQ